MALSLTQLPHRQQSVCKVNVLKRKQTLRENPATGQKLSVPGLRTPRVFLIRPLVSNSDKRKVPNVNLPGRYSVCCGRAGMTTSGGSSVGGRAGAIYLTLESAMQTRSI